MNTENTSDEALLQEVGERMAQCRLNRNMTQEELAKESGVSVPTVQRMEAGMPVQTLNWFRMMRVLGLLEKMDLFLPNEVVSPLQQLKRKGKERQRASSSEDKVKEGQWSWGESE